MSRRLMREGLKALREAAQVHIPFQFYGPRGVDGLNMPISDVRNQPVPRDIVYDEMSGRGLEGRDPYKSRFSLPKGYYRSPVQAPSVLPPRRAPEGFADLFKRPSRKP